MRKLIFLILLLVLPLALWADEGQDLEREYGLVKDKTTIARIDAISSQVTKTARELYPKLPQLQFKGLKTPELNACALPDGRIYITEGMMGSVADDEQIFAVLAHEAAHVGEGHGKGQIGSAVGGAIFAGAVVIALGGDADDIKTGALIGAGLFAMKRSRQDEYEADAQALSMLHKAGKDPQAMGKILFVLQQKYGNGPAKTPVLGWLASHPDTQNRIEAVNKLCANYPAPPKPICVGPNIPLDISKRPRVAVVISDQCRSGWRGFWGRYETCDAALRNCQEEKLLNTGVFVVVSREARKETWEEQDLGKTGRMDPTTVPKTGKTVGANYFLYLNVANYEVIKSFQGRVTLRGKSVEIKQIKAVFSGTARLISVERSALVAAFPFSTTETANQTELEFGRWTQGVDLNWETNPAGKAVGSACEQVANTMACQVLTIINNQ